MCVKIAKKHSRDKFKRTRLISILTPFYIKMLLSAALERHLTQTENEIFVDVQCIVKENSKAYQYAMTSLLEVWSKAQQSTLLKIPNHNQTSNF